MKPTMNNFRIEIAFIILVILISIGGFWELFLGVDANPNGFHYLHLFTSLIWLILLFLQLIYIQKKKFALHRYIGLAIFLLGPLIVATVAVLSVHSAYEAMVSGQEDMLIVQNIMVTIELGIIILLAFGLRNNRKLHGNFLMSSAILFFGIALVFFLVSFIPQFKIEGPETFYRFLTAASTSRWICVAISVFFFFKDIRNGWPWIIVGSFFFINEFINSMVRTSDGIKPLTDFIGAINQTGTFILVLMGFLALLIKAWQRGINKKLTKKIKFNKRQT